MYELKNGQKNTTPTFLCLCFDHKLMPLFFQKKDMTSFVYFLKKFNFNYFAKLGIVFYQATFSYFLGGNCRYYPSCSNYAHEAYSQHGLFSASILVFKRLLSCHPFSSKSFYDPVPLNSIEKSPLL